MGRQIALCGQPAGAADFHVAAEYQPGDIAQPIEVRSASGEQDAPRKIPKHPPQLVADLGQVTLPTPLQDFGEQPAASRVRVPPTGGLNLAVVILGDLLQQRDPVTPLRVLGSGVGGLQPARKIARVGPPAAQAVKRRMKMAARVTTSRESAPQMRRTSFLSTATSVLTVTRSVFTVARSVLTVARSAATRSRVAATDWIWAPTVRSHQRPSSALGVSGRVSARSQRAKRMPSRYPAVLIQF